MKWRNGLYLLSILMFVLALLLHFDAYEVFIFQEKNCRSIIDIILFPFQEFIFQANDGGSINAILLNAPNQPKA